MTTIIDNQNKTNRKVIAGIIVLIAGSLLLINQMDLFFVPAWLFSWPMFMIAYGVYMGAKYNFKKPIWIWIMVLGTTFLITQNIDNGDRFVWPLSIIGIGTWMVLKHNSKRTDVPQQEDAEYKEL